MHYTSNRGHRKLKIIFLADLHAQPVISGGAEERRKESFDDGEGRFIRQYFRFIKSCVPQDIYINGKRAIGASNPNVGFPKSTKVSEKKHPIYSGMKQLPFNVLKFLWRLIKN
jgi:hypothetical protein